MVYGPPDGERSKEGIWEVEEGEGYGEGCCMGSYAVRRWGDRETRRIMHVRAWLGRDMGEWNAGE